MFCRKCGTELPDESKFCSKCGNETIKINSPIPVASENKGTITSFLLLIGVSFFIVFVTVLIAININFTSSPSDVVRTFYKSLADNDTKKLVNYISIEDRNVMRNIWGDEGTEMFFTMFRGSFNNMSPETVKYWRNVRILSEKINGNKAVVRVAFDDNIDINLVKNQGKWKINLGLSDMSNLFNWKY